MPQQASAIYRLSQSARKGAVGPEGYLLRVNCRHVGPQVIELLLLFVVQPPFTTSLFWRLLKAVVLVGLTSTY